MQQRKKVVFIADSLDNAHKFQAVLSGLDVEVAAGSLNFPPKAYRFYPISKKPW